MEKREDREVLRCRLAAGSRNAHRQHTNFLSSTIVENVLKSPDVETVAGSKSTVLHPDGWHTADLVLGGIGFLDRFKEIRISYPRSITVIW